MKKVLDQEQIEQKHPNMGCLSSKTEKVVAAMSDVKDLLPRGGKK